MCVGVCRDACSFSQKLDIYNKYKCFDILERDANCVYWGFMSVHFSLFLPIEWGFSFYIYIIKSSITKPNRVYIYIYILYS